MMIFCVPPVWVAVTIIPTCVHIFCALFSLRFFLKQKKHKQLAYTKG